MYKYINNNIFIMERFRKALSERIYLLSAYQCSTDNWKFYVRGQSDNVYRQEIFSNNIMCSCPDYNIRKTFCKHLLFLIARVSNSPDIAKKLCLNEIKWKNDIFEICANNWLNRLKGRLEDTQTECNNSEAIGNDCSICFEEMKTGETFSQCITTCKNYFHEGCLKLWFNSNHNTCPLCRATWVNSSGKSNEDNMWLEIDRNHSLVMLMDNQSTDLVEQQVEQQNNDESDSSDSESEDEQTETNIEIKLSLNEKVIDLCRRYNYNYRNIYYEFIKPENINYNRKFILIDKQSLSTVRGDIVKEMLGLNNIDEVERIKPIYLEDYYVFINCISSKKQLDNNYRYINL